MITISGDKDFEEARRVVKSWPRRAKALRRVVAYEAAQKTYAGLLALIPSDRAWHDYRLSLQVVQIYTGKGETGFAVRSNPDYGGAEKQATEESILFVRARRGVKRPNPAIEVLERYNPWTLDTLPFTPKKMDATIFARKANQAETDKVRKRRIKDRPMWKSELSRVGVRVKDRPSKKSVPKVVSDVAHMAFNLEFGIGTRAVPHWRPAIGELKRSAPKRIANNPKVQKLFSDPSFTGWKRWEKLRGSAKIRQGEARKFVPFQRKLGIRT